MKSSYYDLTDKYYGGFCGSGDMVSVVDENVRSICSPDTVESDHKRDGQEVQHYVYLLSGSIERTVDSSENICCIRRALQ